MYRCIRYLPGAFGALAFCVAASFASAADAQMQRPFPADALRGTLVVKMPPVVQLNGRDARLSPGSRIRDQNNMIAMSGSLTDTRLVVNYTTDSVGLIRDVWVLTDAERAKRPWPTTPEQAAAWAFDPQTQTWSRP